MPGRTPISRNPRGDPVAVLVEVAERDVPVFPLALAVVAERFDHGHRVGGGSGPFPSNAGPR